MRQGQKAGQGGWVGYAGKKMHMSKIRCQKAINTDARRSQRSESNLTSPAYTKVTRTMIIIGKHVSSQTTSKMNCSKYPMALANAVTTSKIASMMNRRKMIVLMLQNILLHKLQQHRGVGCDRPGSLMIRSHRHERGILVPMGASSLHFGSSLTIHVAVCSPCDGMWQK